MSAMFAMLDEAFKKGVQKPEPGLVDILAAEKAKPKQYVHFVNCIGKDCDESVCGKCGRGQYEHPFNPEPEDFPADGKCLYPFFDLYDPDLAALGAYETETK
jgi:hypothetical protein